MLPTPSHRVSKASVVLLGALVSSAWGCAHLPKTGAEATGEPLAVDFRTETHTYQTQAKVGEVVNRDSSGRVVGTSEVYENRTGSYDVQRWQVFQGETRIDDQDFFRIGGDLDTAKEIAASRQSGMTMNRVGIGMMIGGGALAVGGFVLASMLTKTDPTTGSTTTPGWAYPAASIGMVTVSVGGILTFIGLAKVKREHPVEDPQRANAVAKKYNKSLGSGASASSDEEEEPKPKKKKKKKKPVEEDEE